MAWSIAGLFDQDFNHLKNCIECIKEPNNLGEIHTNCPSVAQSNQHREHQGRNLIPLHSATVQGRPLASYPFSTYPKGPRKTTTQHQTTSRPFSLSLLRASTTSIPTPSPTPQSILVHHTATSGLTWSSPSATPPPHMHTRSRYRLSPDATGGWNCLRGLRFGRSSMVKP